MTKLMELKDKQKGIRIVVTVKQVEPEVEVTTKKGETVRKQAIIVSDGESDAYLALWRDQVNMFKVNDKLELINGYATMYEGNVNLTAGISGIIKKVDK